MEGEEVRFGEMARGHDDEFQIEHARESEQQPRHAERLGSDRSIERRRRIDVMRPKAGHPRTFDAAETLTVAGSVEHGNQEN